MKIKNKIISFVLDKSVTALVSFSVALLFFIPGFSLIKSDFTYKSWYDQDDPQVKQFQNFEKTFGNDDSVIITFHHKDGIINTKSLGFIKEFQEQLWLTKDIIRVDSILNFQNIEANGDDLNIDDLILENEIKELDEKTKEQIKSRIKNNPAILGDFISKDYRSAIVIGKLRPAIESIPDNDLLSKTIKKELLRLKTNYPETTYYITGSSNIVHEFKQATLEDISLILPILYLILILILFYRYKSKLTITLIFSTISLSTLFMLGLCGYLNLEFNSLTSASPTILMTIALSDAVHIFSSFFIGLKDKMSYKDACRYSFEKNFYPTLLTTLTTALGFLSFYGAKVQSVSDLGVMIAFGAVFAWIVTYFALCPCIVLCEKWLGVYSGGGEATGCKKNSQFGDRAIVFIDKYKKTIIVLTGLVSFLGLYLITLLSVNMDPMAQFKESHNVSKSTNFLMSKFSYKSIYDVVIDSEKIDGAKEPEFLERVNKFENWLVTHQKISKVNSILTIIKSTNRNLNQGEWDSYEIPKTKDMVAETLLLYSMGVPSGKSINDLVDTGYQKIRLSILNSESRSLEALKLIELITEKGKRSFGLNVEITGKTPLFHKLTPYVVETFVTSLLSALVAITIILIFALRSIPLGFLTLIPNVFPLLVGGIIFYISGLEVDIGTVIVASVCLGIAVDDSIHFLFEYKKNKLLNLPVLENLKDIFNTTFPALIMTTTLIVVGFLTFIFGQYVPNIKFGVFVAIVLAVALMADFIVLPAILLLLSKDER